LYFHRFDPVNKRIRINIDSKSLGDTLAWIPQIHEFSKKWPDSEIYCACFFPEFVFERMYSGIRFIKPDSELENVYATYNIGCYYEDIVNRHPNDPRIVPLGQVAADILGIRYREIRPKIHIEDTRPTLTTPYVCIATQSTAACKLWQFEGGWQEIIDYLNTRGYAVVLIQKEEGDFRRVINKSGNYSLQARVTDLLHCEFFIGLGSGLSWLAWALGKPVVLISGFSQPFAEFEMNCYRVMNKNVCHGCWNSTQFVFDRSDWNWCPLHRSTPREFECSREITPRMIIEKIDQLAWVK
jgi:autotransporter strand-loop-strand O-heptosyltransferase